LAAVGGGNHVNLAITIDIADGDSAADKEQGEWLM
jgi:hypothetical protein